MEEKLGPDLGAGREEKLGPDLGCGRAEKMPLGVLAAAGAGAGEERVSSASSSEEA